MYLETFSTKNILYSVDSWSRSVLLFLDCFVQLLLGDHEFLHIRNFLSYFLCNCVHPLWLRSFGVIFPDSCPELFIFFQFRYLFFQMHHSLKFSLDFFKHFVIAVLALLIFMRFLFLLRCLDLYIYFFKHISSSFQLNCLVCLYFQFLQNLLFSI